MKKFLLITYYWPPQGGVAVLRWAKMAKYISDYGWEPVIYTPSNSEIGAYDESMLSEIPPHLTVIRTPIWEPYNLYKAFLGRKKKDKVFSGFISKNKRASLLQRISVFIRGNFFIPDARMFWIRPSVKFLKKYLAENPVDAIVTNGTPHSMHLIGEKLYRITGIPWVADFRDPWTNMNFYHELQLTRWADNKHHRLEKKVLQNADKVVCVTWRVQEEFKAISGRDDIEFIPNGFDDADFPRDPNLQLDKDFTIVHVGSMDKERNFPVFWSAVSKAMEASPMLKEKLKLRFIGPYDFSSVEAVKEAGLEPYTEFIDFVPHQEIVKITQQSQVLLMLINTTPNVLTLIPAKLFEYLASGRPFLAIGPKNGDSARLMEMTQSGTVFDYGDEEGIKNQILAFFDAYLQGTLKGSAQGIEKFTRRHLASRFAGVLDEVTSGAG